MKRRNLVEPVDVTKAAGESIQTDPSAFIEQQRQLSREDDQQEEHLQRRLNEIEERVKRMEEQLREKDREWSERERELRNFQTQLREKELQEASLLEQLREKHQQQENLQRQLRQMKQQLTNLLGEFQDKQDQTANLQEQVTTQERQLRIKDHQVNEWEMTLSTAQQRLSEHQGQQVTPDWVISRDQIQLTENLLGRGGWGVVFEGKYCGCSVAVKQIHELILSPHNRSLFKREMDIASRCHHPCLLLFIGATDDVGRPLFVTIKFTSVVRAETSCCNRNLHYFFR